MSCPLFLFRPPMLAFFNVANYIEAGFWGIVAAGFAIAAFRQVGVTRHHCWLGAAVFLLFGLSDVVEVQTGAWYRPWWLLVWKGLCLLVILYLLIVYLRQRRQPITPSTAPETPSPSLPRPESAAIRRRQGTQQ